MQHLSREILRRVRRIDFIAEYGVPEMMKMYPNLMGTPAVQPALE